MNKLLQRAMEYEKKEEEIGKDKRPFYHLASRIGWMNDPNGFSYYDGKYHLFYQYYPYNTQWGPMHWGHAVSEDLVSWKYLPVALAPDQAYDQIGCFSGSATTLPDGRQLLIYTGVRREEDANGEAKDIQTQCIAIGDGKNYQKYEGNPVITEDMLPAGSSRYDFRDPKIWEEDGTYYCVVGNCTEDRDGQILLFKSADGMSWEFEQVLIKNQNRFGKMWECPDFFELDGKRVLLTSPQEMYANDLEFYNGNGTLYMTGMFDEQHQFQEESYGCIDYGIDFYAPQTTQTTDGRRIMIAWMQNWDTIGFRKNLPWFGQMSLPREISLRDGKLLQRPVREIETYYGEEIVHDQVQIMERQSLKGIKGRCIDLEFELNPAEQENCYHKFELHFADNGTAHTVLRYEPEESIVTLDRKYSGTRNYAVHQRSFHVNKKEGALKVRLILDRYSVEAFFNDGEQAASMTFYTDSSAEDIYFQADRKINLSVRMHQLKMGE